MKLLFISQYFFHESFKGNDIVFDFIQRGNEVTVLTGKPNYPEGKFYDGYTFLNWKEEYIKGTRIIRTPIIPRGNGKGIFLIINYLSFVFFSYFTCLFRIREKYDAIFVQQLSSVSMALSISQIGPKTFSQIQYRPKTIPLYIRSLQVQK